MVEAIVSLALFALVGLAGLGLITSIIGVQSRTEGRLDELAQMQRAIAIMTQDVEQLSSGPTLEPDGALSLTRPITTGLVQVKYQLKAGRLERVIGEDGRVQVLLDHVSALSWSSSDGETWTNGWPASGTTTKPRPVALAVNLTLTDTGTVRGTGELRRVIRVPTAP